MSITSTLFGFLDPTTILIFMLTLLVFYFLTNIRRGNQPPGPVPFPFLGNLPQLILIKNPYETYTEWAKYYGDVFMLKIGDQNMVIVNGYKLTREALIEKPAAFEDRPSWLYVIEQLFSQKGILWSNGDPHRSIRKFTAVTLRDFGVGKKSLEERILDEARMMVDDVNNMAAKGTPFYPKEQLVNAVSNIICGIVFGSRFDYGDAEFRKLQEMLDYLFKHASVAIPENFFPWLRWLGLRSPAKPLVRNSKVIKDFVKRKIDEHEITYDASNIRDYIDLYIKSVKEGVSRDHLTEEDILRAVEDLFLAGSESTSMTLVWTLLYMVHYPKVQLLCQQEISNVVGDSRQVTLADKPQLPYLQATIQEVQRIANTIPFTAPHATTCDVELGGHVIPRGAIVLFSLYSIHTDPEHWPEPMKLRPERWLDEDGQLKKSERFLPFSLGPRTCLGEPLAKMELFLFFTNLLQAFTFKPVPGEDLPPLKGSQPGMTMQPTPYNVIAERR